MTLLLLFGNTLQTLTPSLFVNSNTFYSPTVLSTAYLTPSLFSNSNSFYTPVLLSTVTLTPSNYTNSNTFFAATVSASNTLLPALLVNSNTFYTALLVANVLHPPFVRSQNVIGPANIIQRYDMTAVPFNRTHRRNAWSQTLPILTTIRR